MEVEEPPDKPEMVIDSPSPPSAGKLRLGNIHELEYNLYEKRQNNGDDAQICPILEFYKIKMF